MQIVVLGFHRLSCVLSLLLLLVILSAAGCGGGQQFAEVAGKVTHRGKAPNVQGLMIVFFSSAGKVVATNVELDGTYKAPKVPVGETRVGFTIAGLGEDIPENADPSKAIPRPGQKSGASYDKDKLSIPIKYLDPLKSGLKLTVERDKKSDFNPDLK